MGRGRPPPNSLNQSSAEELACVNGDSLGSERARHVPTFANRRSDDNVSADWLWKGFRGSARSYRTSRPARSTRSAGTSRGSGAAWPKGGPGARGEAGPPGPQGIPGAQGAAGPVGPQGPQGVNGDKGEKGDPGASASIRRVDCSNGRFALASRSALVCAFGGAGEGRKRAMATGAKFGPIPKLSGINGPRLSSGALQAIR
jgi:hypothetical protein